MAQQGPENATYTERKTCRACGHAEMETKLDLGNQYLVGFVKKKDESLPRAPLDWCRCTKCGLLQLRHTTNPNLLWTDYWYRSGVNETMVAALRDVVQDGLRYHQDGLWVDIGANDGTLLSKVPGSFHKIAVEPALNIAALAQEHADIVVSNYFSAEHVPHRKCDVITSCAMFYDVDEPGQFVEDIAKCLSPNGIWINQLSSTPHMLEANAFDNICHEHVCYYDVSSLWALYEAHGLSIVSIKFNDINGGSMRVIASRRRDRASLAGVPLVLPEDVDGFVNRIHRWKDLMQQVMFGDLTLDDDIWLYGASTKVSVLLQYLGAGDRIKAAADRNPAKHGLLMAGTWIPIKDEEAMRKDAPRHLLVGPWAFRKEFLAREAPLRARGTTMWFPLPNIEAVL